MELRNTRKGQDADRINAGLQTERPTAHQDAVAADVRRLQYDLNQSLLTSAATIYSPIA